MINIQKKKNTLLFLLIFLSITIYSQITFEKGYYIDNSGTKINCFIKNTDWKNTPTWFNYKLTKTGDSKKASINSIKEFSINNVSKFVRATVNIDRSSEITNNLSKYRKPIFNEETLFLKVLIHGKASLYQYIDKNLERFFYRLDDGKIEQLIYKSYLTENYKVGKNNRFKQQLWKNLKCSALKIGKIDKLSYEKKSLINVFKEYNTCKNENFISYEKTKINNPFNLTLRPGVNFSSLAIANRIASSRDTNFDDQLSVRFGVEVEYILPFNKNKWSIILEPTFQYYNSEKSTIESDEIVSNVNYSSIEIPIGLRHYFFLNNDSRIFINASYIFDIGLTSDLTFKRADGTNYGTDLELKSNTNLAFGVGYKIQKYSLEARFQTNRNLLHNYTYWNSDYKTFSVIFGYTIF